MRKPLRFLLVFSFVVLSLSATREALLAHEPTSARDCAPYAPAPPFADVAATYRPKYHTIAQTLLERERGAGPVTPSEFAILDSLIDEGVSRLRPIPTNLSDRDYDTFAGQALRTIDCVLVRHGFVYPGKGLVQLLSDGLDPTMYPTSTDVQSLLNSGHNLGRQEFIKARAPGPFYVVDCDIASFIYLGIAEQMSYPLYLVDMPLHNFVRWVRYDGRFIDFETMDGSVTSDAYYVSGWSIPAGFVGVGGILTTMSRPQVIAYADFTSGNALIWKGEYTKAIKKYEDGVSLDSIHSESANQLAWFYSVVPDQRFRNGSKAVHFAQIAAGILPDGDVLDTLACAYGAAGDFPDALTAEDRAVALDYAPEGSDVRGDRNALATGKTCADPTFGKDPKPFRPEHSRSAKLAERCEFNSLNGMRDANPLAVGRWG